MDKNDFFDYLIDLKILELNILKLVKNYL